jgi:hypothetical protein
MTEQSEVSHTMTDVLILARTDWTAVQVKNKSFLFSAEKK